MSNIREVSTLPIAKKLIDLLVSRGFRNVSDVQEMQPRDLATELNLPIEIALEILQSTNSSKINIGFTAKDLILKVSKERSIITFCRLIDRMLGGGVPLGQVTEFCGVPGIGKTQIAMQLALDVQIPEIFAGCDGEAIYIDTEGSFMVDRIAELAGSLSAHLLKIANKQPQIISPDLLNCISRDKLLQGISVYRPLDSTELMAIVTRLPHILTSNPKIKLLVIDSAAFLFRKDLLANSTATSTSHSKRQVVHELAQILQRLACEYGVAVAVTNHVTSKFDPGSGIWTTVPALGLPWFHAVTSRVMLAWQETTRTAALVKSPSRPLDKVAFRILPEGVRDCPTAPSGSSAGSAIGDNSSNRKRKADFSSDE